MNRAALLCLMFLVALAGRAVAAEVTASVDKNRVQTGGQIVLTLRVEGGGGDYPNADFTSLQKDFEVMSAGTTQRTSIVNGRMTSSRERRYILVPKTAGQFTLGPLDIRVGGETHTTNPITITVTSAPPPPAPPPLTEGEAGNTTGSDALFVQATVDNPHPYQYEQVTLRIRLYTRYQLLDNPGYTEPTTQGFWKENLPAPDLRVETVDGVRYNVLETMLALFPTKPGELTIGEAVLDCSVNDGSQSRDAFSFFQRPSGHRVVLRTKPVTINVQPLPPPPAGFQGAVGEYRLQVRADTHEVVQGEPVTVDVSLSGTGHLRTVGEIELPPLPDFRSYPSEENQEITRNRGLIGGEITKQFVLVPLKAGKLTVPPLRVVTFSPSQKEYRVLEGPPIELEVTPGSGMEARGSRGDIELLGRDIRFIELGDPSFRPLGDRWSRALRWLALLPLPTLALGGAWFWNRRMEAQGANAVWIRRRNAGKTARSILRAAQGKDKAESAAEAARALRTFVADRYDLPAAGLTPDVIAGHLTADGKDAQPVLAFLDRCDAVRFAPQETATGGDFLKEAENHLALLEEK